VFLLNAVSFLFIVALVSTGIAALFQAMPPKYQPPVTPFLAYFSTTYLRHAPRPKNIWVVVTVAFSSIAILLACIPLFNALHSTGRKRPAAILLGAFVLLSLVHLGQAAYACLDLPNLGRSEAIHYQFYFAPDLLLDLIDRLTTDRNFSLWTSAPSIIEAGKWSMLLITALLLTTAQWTAWSQNTKTKTPEPPLPSPQDSAPSARSR